MIGAFGYVRERFSGKLIKKYVIPECVKLRNKNVAKPASIKNVITEASKNNFQHCRTQLKAITKEVAIMQYWENGTLYVLCQFFVLQKVSGL